MHEGYVFKPLDLKALSSQERKTFMGFAPREFHWCLHQTLQSDEIKGTVLAFGAWKGDRPVGLALGYAEEQPFLGKIFSLWVEESHRQKKVGSALFEALMQTLKGIGCRHLVFTYPAEIPTLTAIEHILKKHSWEGPRVFIKRYKFDGFTFNPDWVNKPYQLQEGFEEFPWHTLKKSEMDKIRHQIAQGHFEPLISPLGHDENIIEPLNSLGLRYKGEVVGWMVTHRIARDTIRYSSLYIQKGYPFRKNWIKLLSDAINLQRQSPVQWALFEINLQQVDTSWLNFVTQKLAPHAISITQDLQSWFSFYLDEKHTSI